MTIQITVHCDDAILGSGEWSPELRVTMDEDSNCSIEATESHSSENATPMDIWHHRTLQWSNRLSQGSMTIGDRAKLEELGVQIKPLLERVHEGHSIEWNGSNMVGGLDDDATEASEEIDRIVEEADWTSEASCWDASEFVAAALDETAQELGLTADASDAEADQAADKLIALAKNDGVVLVNVNEAVEFIIGHLRAQRDGE